MPNDARDNKAILRTEVRKKLSSLSPLKKVEQSANIRNLILSRVGSNCAIFAGTENEPNLLPLIENEPHITWFLPKVIGDGLMEFHQIKSLSQLKAGAFGILEPDSGAIVDPSEIKMIVCPGLAFSKTGQRLGQGGGFYDRFLSLSSQASTYGACFDEQITDSLPMESHDHRVSGVLHPSFGT